MGDQPSTSTVTTAHGLLGLHARRNLLYRLIDHLASRGATAVIAVSADTRRQLVAAGSPTGRTVVILNGLGEPDRIALGSVAEQRGKGGRRSIRVGYLGRLSIEKGTRELLEIARALLTENVSASFEIAGTGPDRAWLEDASTDLTETGRLTFRGTVEDVVAFLAEIDVLVMPSHNEGLPYVLLEAMSAGCAIVAFRVGGIPEVMNDASLGVLIKPGDVDAFVRAVIDLAADPLRVSALGQAAASHVSTHFALIDRRPLLALAYGREASTNNEAETPSANRTG
jgi:glycosyltransferase involved in cell wall biosynthesis